MAEEKKSHLPGFLKKLLHKNKDKTTHEAGKSPGERNISASKVQLARLDVVKRVPAINHQSRSSISTAPAFRVPSHIRHVKHVTSRLSLLFSSFLNSSQNNLHISVSNNFSLLNSHCSHKPSSQLYQSFSYHPVLFHSHHTSRRYGSSSH